MTILQDAVPHGPVLFPLLVGFVAGFITGGIAIGTYAMSLTRADRLSVKRVLAPDPAEVRHG